MPAIARARGTASVRRAVPHMHAVTSDRGRRSYTIDIFSFSPLSPTPHVVCIVTPALAKTRADRKVFQLVEFADRARRTCARTRVCVCERALAVRSCMQSQCERVKGLVHQRVVLTGRHDIPTLAPAGHSLLLEHFVARSLITGAKPIHILHHVHTHAWSCARAPVPPGHVRTRLIATLSI
jgi:hypothetical protein